MYYHIQDDGSCITIYIAAQGVEESGVHVLILKGPKKDGKMDLHTITENLGVDLYTTNNPDLRQIMTFPSTPMGIASCIYETLLEPPQELAFQLGTILSNSYLCEAKRYLETLLKEELVRR